MDPITLSYMLAALPSVLRSIKSLTEFADKSIVTLKQAKELTPEQEAARDALIAERQAMSHWQQD